MDISGGYKINALHMPFALATSVTLNSLALSFPRSALSGQIFFGKIAFSSLASRWSSAFEVRNSFTVLDGTGGIGNHGIFCICSLDNAKNEGISID